MGSWIHTFVCKTPSIIMPLKTTVIGAWPKPSYLNIKDWFQSGQNSFNPAKSDEPQTSEEILQKAIDEVVAKQLDLGIDIVNDGEIARETYFSHFVKRIKGMNPDNVVDKKIRNGACDLKAISIESKIESGDDWAYIEWQRTVKAVEKWLKNQNFDGDIESEAKSRVKYTLPGPMTIMDCTMDSFYGNDKKKDLIDDLIGVINKEILSLANHGCQYIQLDEPVLMRYPEDAINYGIEDAKRCFSGLPEGITSIVHLCCGYPTYVDQNDYMKADKNLYIKLAELLEKSGIHQVSIEDAEAKNDLEALLPNFKNMTVILGAITIARSKIEEFETLQERIKKALELMENPEKLVLAPDCGLGFLNEEQIHSKLEAMVKVAKSF